MPTEALPRASRPMLPDAVSERASASEGSSSLYILWGFFALAALGAAVAICFTPGAERRLSSALAPGTEIGSPSPLEMARLAKQQSAPEPDAALMARLNALEDQLGIMTGSISPRPSRTEFGTDITPPMPSVTTETSSAGPSSPLPRSDATDIAVAPTQTKFALDLGSATSFSSLRDRWDMLKTQHPELGRLSPRISVRDVDGRVELRLVAGPFDNAADAARACAGLLAKGAECDGSLFDGQRLPQS